MLTFTTIVKVVSRKTFKSIAELFTCLFIYAEEDSNCCQNVVAKTIKTGVANSGVYSIL